MNTPTELERDALAALDHTWQWEVLGGLIRCRSDGGQELAVQELMATTMAEVGMRVDTWSIDLEALRQDPQHSEEIRREAALGVVGSVGQRAGPHLAWNGHVDVVGPGRPEDWRHPVWDLTMDDVRAYGRGTVDMKGALSCALAAIRALRDAGLELTGELSLQSVVGEEDGGTGTLACIHRGHRADAAVVLEPTGLDIAPAHCGALNFRLRVAGCAAHGCMRDEGVSAIAALQPLLGAVEALERDRNGRFDVPEFATYTNPLPISMGTIHGGDWASTVPDWVEVEGRYGVAPGETFEAAVAEFEAAITIAAAADAWLAEHPPRIEWWGGRFEPARTPTSHPLIGLLGGAAEAGSGRSAELRGMTYGADMRLLTNVAEIPTVMFGPGDVRQAHTADEYVPVQDLIDCARTLLVLAIRYCGVAG